MATLEKIRSRSGLLFGIIIVALLAFILTDFFNSSRSFFGPGTAAAKVDGHKIDYQKFNQRVEQARQQMQDRGYANVDLSTIQQEVLNAMVYEELLNQEMDKLGITVTDNELSQAMLGSTAIPAFAQQIIQNYGMTPDQLHEMAFNPAKYQIPADQATQLQQLWTSMEQSLEQQLKQGKLGNLFAGALTANKLDAKDIFEQNAVSSAVNYAKVDYSTLSDEEFKPSEDEVKAKYNELKSQFRLQEPVRKVQYITVDIRPSEEDLVKAQQDVEAAIELLNTQEGVEGLSGLFVTNTTNNKKDAMRSSLSSLLDTLPVGKAQLMSFANNTYTIAKLLGKNEGVKDSVNYEYGVITVTGPAQRDSLIAVLNNGGSLEEVTKGQFQPATTSSLIGGEAAPLRELIDGAATGRFFTPDTAANAQQVRVIRVNSYTPAVTTYEVAEIKYQVDPSTTTVNKLRQDLVDYIAKNNTAEKFVSEAAAAGYNVYPAEVMPGSLSIANIPETRSTVKWALKAKKGDVSKVSGDEQNGKFIAAALTDIYKDGYVPLREQGVYDYVSGLAMNDKKAAKLIADYKGKGNSVAEYAAAMNVEADTTDVIFGQFVVSGFPFNENIFTAAASVAEKGKLMGPLQSNSAVVVFNVISREQDGRDFNFENDALRFNQTQGSSALGNMMYQILLGKNVVENNILNFYADQE